MYPSRDLFLRLFFVFLLLTEFLFDDGDGVFDDGDDDLTVTVLLKIVTVYRSLKNTSSYEEAFLSLP